MIKTKKEQIILIVLIPVFLFALLYLRTRGNRVEKVKLIMTEQENKIESVLGKIPKPDGPPNITYEAGPRDPLTNMLKVHIYKLMQDRSGLPSGKELPLPALSIEGLIWNTRIPQAIINGKVVRVGDVIEDVKILKIDKEGIEVEYQGESAFISKR